MASVTLLQKLSSLVGEVFVAHGFDPSMGRVQVSDRPDLAQFQCNGAMAAAKHAKCSPRDVALKIKTSLEQLSHSPIASCEIAGPGFLNFILKTDYLSQHVMEFAQDTERLGVPYLGQGETVILDYGGPNVAKPMHVGHLRSSIIGDSVRRILLFAGYKALGDIHMGDWGTQMGMILSELELRNPNWPYFDKDFFGPYETKSPVTMQDLEDIYPAASAACKQDPERMKKAHQATVDLQNKRAGFYALWQHFMTVSIESMKSNFEALNVHFDLWKGEADVHDLIGPMVQDLRQKNFAVEDQGAIVIPIKTHQDSKDYPPLILYKRDGAVMYGTTDLATLVERKRDFDPAKVVYIVDQRQSLHFDQLFRAARLCKIIDETVELTHAGFGTMNGTDGKPFKTRAGGVMKLEDLIETATDKAKARLQDNDPQAKNFSAEEFDDIAKKVAIAAVKFADLQNNRIADYVFDMDRFMMFEGKTGPYLLYQTVRIESLMEKAGYHYDPSHRIHLSNKDCDLALMLSALPESIFLAARSYCPHILCDHAYRLAQAFSQFYAKNHILSESDPDQKQSWLALCALTARQLRLSLYLLGIEIPKRM
jgi:arginyl-tRNA synthetase